VSRLFLRELRDAVFPPRCRLCGGAASDGQTCERHVLPLGLVGARCSRCASSLPAALQAVAVCRACRTRPPGLRGVIALGDYRESLGLSDWVLAFKHGGRRDLAPHLAEGLSRLLVEDRRGAHWRRVLVPVPAHPARRLERGYDQAAILARAVGERSHVAVASVLRRRRNTPVQGGPGARSRRANVRGAFVTRPGARLDGADAWLVDDVLTSGATAQACAIALRAGGARAVYVLCLARAGTEPT
jgi:ComF family protein